VNIVIEDVHVDIVIFFFIDLMSTQHVDPHRVMIFCFTTHGTTLSTQGDTKSRYSSRYIGSMVGDVHRSLLYGGIFGYPADKRNPNGKLRLLYEAAPMAFLIEQAGGLALTGKNRIMDIPPITVHQRVPCILGSREDVLEMRRYYVESQDPELIARCEARVKGAAVLDDNSTDNDQDGQQSATFLGVFNDDTIPAGLTGAAVGEYGSASP
jgi:hypothetical protein